MVAPGCPRSAKVISIPARYVRNKAVDITLKEIAMLLPKLTFSNTSVPNDMNRSNRNGRKKGNRTASNSSGCCLKNLDLLFDLYSPNTKSSAKASHDTS